MIEARHAKIGDQESEPIEIWRRDDDEGTGLTG